MTYHLDLMISPDDLEGLRHSNLSIVIGEPSTNNSYNVAWYSFDPFEINTVEWEGGYGIYASLNTSLEPGTVINIVSDVNKADLGTKYDFDESATFKVAGKSSLPHAFEVMNDMPASSNHALTFGMMKQATIQGLTEQPSPVNAIVIPSHQQLLMEPKQEVSLLIWLLTDVESGSIINQNSSDATLVNFRDSDKINLTYDKASGKFTGS